MIIAVGGVIVVAVMCMAVVLFCPDAVAGDVLRVAEARVFVRINAGVS